MRVEDLFAWIKERYSIFQKKEAGKPKPWTQDPYMRHFKFCNVYREDDRVSRWITEHWRTPECGNPHLWFAMTVARFINSPDSLEDLGFPVPWNPVHFIRVLQDRQRRGLKVFSGAYIVSTNGRKMDKLEYLSCEVLTPMWKTEKYFTNVIRCAGALEEVHVEFMQLQGMGSFMTAQVIADLKFCPPLNAMPDWWTWAASGPGSRRGLNRVVGRDKDSPWREVHWLEQLRELQKEIDKMAHKNKMPRISAQDLQNCLCEFDKYERTRLGEGRPRSTYPGV